MVKDNRLMIVLLAAVISQVAVAQQPKTIKFSGYEWIVRDQLSGGPGPNLWKSKNVWLDKKGMLHLKIAKSGEAWSCKGF